MYVSDKQSSRRNPLSLFIGYALAVAAVSISLVLRQILTALVGDGLPTYITFYPTIMTAALVAGFGPGLLATVLTDLVVSYWVLPPSGFPVGSLVDRVGLLIFTAMGLFMSGVAELYRRNRQKAAAYDREQTLRESQARLASFAQATFEGIVEVEDGQIVDCNEQFAAMSGYTVGELKGRDVVDLVTFEDRDKVLEGIRASRDRDVVVEIAALRKDGTRFIVEAHGRPITPGTSKVHAAIRDITDQKRAEQALMTLHDELERRIELRTAELATANTALERENAERRKAEEAQRVAAEAFRDLYNNAPCGYHSLNADGVFVRINDTELKWLGYERDEVIGKLRFSDLLTPEGKDAFRVNFSLLKERGQVYDLEFKMLKKDGTVLPVLLSATVVRNDNGDFLNCRSTLFDISERKKAEAEIVRAAKLATLGELAASVAHEINNPLNSVINYAQILKDQGHGQSKGYDLAGEIVHEGTRMAGIVRNLLSYAREGTPDKRSISVEDIVNNSVALCTAALRRERIEVRVDIEKGLPLVTGHLQQLQQVILNLISNARHALKERYRGLDSGAVLEIRGEEVAEGGGFPIRISVWDNGIGIPSALLQRVTEPFFTTRPPEMGTGLGLSISKKIIEDHRGRLAVESVHGQYTKVLIELPVAKESGREGVR